MADRLELKANRMDLVSRWADDLAHEIKNPLHAMVINLELVKRRAGSAEPAPLVERVQVVESELERVHSLIEAMLRLVRPWSIQGVAQVDRVFEDLLPVLQARARIRKVDFVYEGGYAVVAMPPGNLTLLLLNIIDQTLDATPAGGSIISGCRLDGDLVNITVRHTVPEPGGSPDRNTADGSEAAAAGIATVTSLVQEVGGSVELLPAAGEPEAAWVVALPRADAP